MIESSMKNITIKKDDLSNENVFTLIGWRRKIDEKKPEIDDVNHFCVFKSPNSIPWTIKKNIETATNNNDKPYAIKRHHQGNVNLDCFFLLHSTIVSLWKNKNIKSYDQS